MTSVINTNYLSLVAQNNLNKSQSSLNSAIERLSSGMRINSAKDDAAGQAIANRFTANVKGLTQAARNANDGISIAQTTEGSLNEINNNLQRVRELSVQAANGTNSQSDLDSIQAEIKQRLDEIDRVSAQTQFNGVKVLAGDSKLSIQVGANDGETIDIDLKKITSGTLGLGNLDLSKKSIDLSTVASAATTTLVPASSTPTSHALTANDTNASPGPSQVFVSDTDPSQQWVSDGTNYYAVTGYNNTTGELEYDSSTGSTTAPAGASQVTSGNLAEGTVTVDVANVKFKDTNPAAATTFYVDSTGGMYASKDGGTTYSAATLNVNTGVVTFDSSATVTPTNTVSVVQTTAEVPNTTPAVTADLSGLSATDVGTNLSLHKVTNADGSDGGYVVKGTKNGSDVYYKAAVDSTGKVTVSDQLNPDPLAAIDKALASVDSFRSQLGAVQNRFESTITNLNNTTNNLSAARSRIEDADYAVEVSNMTRAQILQQAGTSVLAQANQTTQGVLSLLR